MTLGKIGGLAAILLCSSTLASASGLVFTCDQSLNGNPDNYQAGTCNYLNSTIAGIYNRFNNVNANIYIKQGSTGLGSSATPEVYVSYSDYLGAITGTASGDAVDTGALASLNSLDAAIYGSDNVVISSALAMALGYTGLPGITSTGGNCVLGNANCYSGIITITTSQPLYYRGLGGSLSGSYDYFSVVEHETNEILGTVSCMNTQTGGVLTDPCDAGVGAKSGTGTPAAIDLFRYNSVGNLAANNAYLGLSQAPSGAYFSWNGGLTHGANGAVFNTVANGDDYADFASTCTYVQDGVGCPGVSLDIATDGNAEVNMLDAIGYNLATPEPGTMALFGVAFAGFLVMRRRARG